MKTVFAFLALKILVFPGREFCSWIKVGIPILAAMNKAGPLAKPPVPTAKSGWNSLMIFLALSKLEITLNGKLILAKRFPLSNPAMFNPSILKPACGTFSISIFPLAPMNKNSASGKRFCISCAMATAGKM